MNIEYRLVDLLDSICNALGTNCKEVLETKITGRKPKNKEQLNRRNKITLAKSLFVYWAKYKYNIDNSKLIPYLNLTRQSSLFLYYEQGREYSTELKLDYR